MTRLPIFFQCIYAYLSSWLADVWMKNFCDKKAWFSEQWWLQDQPQEASKDPHLLEELQGSHVGELASFWMSRHGMGCPLGFMGTEWDTINEKQHNIRTGSFHFSSYFGNILFAQQNLRRRILKLHETSKAGRTIIFCAKKRTCKYTTDINSFRRWVVKLLELFRDKPDRCTRQVSVLKTRQQSVCTSQHSR